MNKKHDDAFIKTALQSPFIQLALDMLNHKVSADDFQTQYFRMWSNDDIKCSKIYEIADVEGLIHTEADLFWVGATEDSDDDLEHTEETLRKNVRKLLESISVL